MSGEGKNGHEVTETPVKEKAYAHSASTEDVANLESSPYQHGTLLRDSQRLLRLQFFGLILSHLTKWKSRTEHRKVAMHHDRRMASLHLVLHIVPLSGAITLLTLQWTKYWIGTQTNISTLLQFAAKLHELTMQASLVEVLLCIIRTRMITGYIPLGALSAATHPTQLSYLWSLEFISTFASPTAHGWRKVAPFLAIPFLLLLTSFVGPSSAILMIPRPGTPKVFNDWTAVFSRMSDDVYPSFMDRTTLDFDIEAYNRTMMSERLYENYATKNGHVISRDYIEARDCGTAEARRILLSSHAYWSGLREDPEIFNATLPPCFSVGMAGYIPINDDGSVDPNFWNQTTSITTVVPVVSTKCVDTKLPPMSNDKIRNESIYDTAVHYVHDNGRSTGNLFDFRTLIDRVSSSNGSKSARHPEQDSLFYPPLWMPSPEPGSHSLVGVFPFCRGCAHREDLSSLSWASTLPDPEPEPLTIYVAACTVSAHWHTEKLEKIDKLGVTEVRPLASALTAPHNATPITLDVIGVDEVHSPEFPRNLMGIQGNYYYNFGRSLSELLVGIISRHSVPSTLTKGQKDTRSQMASSPDSDHRQTVETRITTVLWGYGYGNRSTSVWLAMTVMTTYCVITIAYLAYIIVTGSTSTAWNCGIELVALALQSKRPDHIGHMGAGLDSIETFKEGVGIRVNHDNELELVFANDRDVDRRRLRKLERNKAY